MHLQQYLCGEPLQPADRLQYTDDNYFAVLELLEERYSNKYRLRYLLIQDLIDLPPLPSTMLSDMTKFHDDIFQIVDDLRSLPDKDMDDPCNQLAKVLLGKLPFGIRWSLLKETAWASDTTLDGFLSGLNHLIRQTRKWAFTGPFRNDDQRPDQAQI